MEKEMRKLLLVAVSVGVFLLVTITVAIMVLTPKVHTDNAYSSSVPYSHGRTPHMPDIMSNAPPIPAVISSPQEPVFNFEDEIAEDINNGDSLTIQIPRPVTAAVPDSDLITSQERQVVTVRPAPVTPAPEPKPVQPAATTTTRPATTTPAATTTRTVTPARPSTPARSINDYWVQTGAFSSMVRAEDAKELLSTKGLTSIIETRIVNGQNFFRVRLGPYTSENEAKHWLEIVKIIDGFQGSQVRQTVRQN